MLEWLSTTQISKFFNSAVELFLEHISTILLLMHRAMKGLPEMLYIAIH